MTKKKKASGFLLMDSLNPNQAFYFPGQNRPSTYLHKAKDGWYYRSYSGETFRSVKNQAVLIP